MVSTRRSTANTGPAYDSSTKPKAAASTNDTVRIHKANKKIGHLPMTPKIDCAVLNMAPSGNISEHDLSLTSPLTEEAPGTNALDTSRKQCGSTALTERTLSSALRRLAPNPFGNMSGSSHNPIVVTEDSPPHPARAPKRRHRYRRLSENHQFMGKGYRDVYNYHASRSAFESLPAIGSTFTGHQSHEIYRMMNTKLTAAPGWNPNAAWGRHTQNVPFEVQFLAQQQRPASQTPYASPYPQYNQHQAPRTQYFTVPTVPSMHEDMLRKKADQYIQEYSRPLPRKRRLSDADLDETSASESEQPATSARLSKTIPQSTAVSPPAAPTTVTGLQNDKTMVNCNGDSNLSINHIIELSSLVTSLLRIYPHSADQKGLREEISMMVSMQNQHITKWIKSECQSSRKHRKSSPDSAVSLGDIEQGQATALRHSKEQDNALRQVFSASADMWQDGTGHGVADVFAAAWSSSPAIGIKDNHIDFSGGAAGVDKEANAVEYDATSPSSISSPTNNTSGQPTKSVEMKHTSSLSPSNKQTPPNDSPVSLSLDKSTKADQISRQSTSPSNLSSPSSRRSRTPSPSPSRANSFNGKISTPKPLVADEQASIPMLARQDTTSLMEKRSTYYRITKAQNLETNGLEGEDK